MQTLQWNSVQHREIQKLLLFHMLKIYPEDWSPEALVFKPCTLGHTWKKCSQQRPNLRYQSE